MIAQAYKSFLYSRIGKRSISSVVPKSDLEVSDFNVVNEPILGYLPGSQERKDLEASIAKFSSQTEDVPIIIGGKEYRTDNVQYQPMPHDHNKKVAKFYWATPELVQKSIDVALAAKADWEKIPIDDRIKMFLNVADQISTTYRADLNAATMVGQSKTIIQVFWFLFLKVEKLYILGWNWCCLWVGWLLPVQLFLCQRVDEVSAHLRGPQQCSQPDEIQISGGIHCQCYTLQLHGNCRQPGLHTLHNGKDSIRIYWWWNSTYFLKGNATLWKPSDTSILSNYIIYKIFQEAGFPDGLVNFLPCDGPVFGKTVTSHPELAAVNFTGSVP